MRRFNLVMAALIATQATASSQDSIPVDSFARDLKKLIEINSEHQDIINLAGKEAIHITDHATASQIVAITAPYMRSKVQNAKHLCLILLNTALFNKLATPDQRAEITAIICKHYLQNDTDLQMAARNLLRLRARDFNNSARLSIATLIENGLPKFNYGFCAKLLGIAQVKESIPVLWKIVNRDIATMERGDLDILAALSRMDEKEAGVLLCKYYQNAVNRTDYRHVFLAHSLAFSLDKNVLTCLIDNFKTIDPALTFHSGDSYFNPSRHLGIHIVSMLKSYPYADREFSVDPVRVAEWLSSSGNLELADK